MKKKQHNIYIYICMCAYVIVTIVSVDNLKQNTIAVVIISKPGDLEVLGSFKYFWHSAVENISKAYETEFLFSVMRSKSLFVIVMLWLKHVAQVFRKYISSLFFFVCVISIICHIILMGWIAYQWSISKVPALFQSLQCIEDEILRNISVFFHGYETGSLPQDIIFW